jgi:hypothetical protein
MARKTKQRNSPNGLLDQVSGLLGKTGGRGGHSGRDSGGLAAKASSFVAGFMSGGDDRKGGRSRGGRARGRRRR